MGPARRIGGGPLSGKMGPVCQSVVGPTCHVGVGTRLSGRKWFNYSKYFFSCSGSQFDLACLVGPARQIGGGQLLGRKWVPRVILYFRGGSHPSCRCWVPLVRPKMGPVCQSLVGPTHQAGGVSLLSCRCCHVSVGGGSRMSGMWV